MNELAVLTLNELGETVHELLQLLAGALVGQFARRLAVDSHVAGSHRDASVRQGCGRDVALSRRALYAKRLLCFPGRPGLPRGDVGVCCHGSRQADC